MINSGQLDGAFFCRVLVWQFAVEALDGEIEIEKKSSLLVAADHALQPKKRTHARASRHRRDVMQAGRGVKNHVASGQLDALHAVGVFHAEFAAVILVWLREKEGRGEIRADALGLAGKLPDGIVHVRPKRLPARVSVK